MATVLDKHCFMNLRTHPLAPCNRKTLQWIRLAKALAPEIQRAVSNQDDRHTTGLLEAAGGRNQVKPPFVEREAELTLVRLSLPGRIVDEQ